jgi:hypothetical protein
MEYVMPEQPQPDRVPDDDLPPHPAEPLQINTPVIDIQDLEHKSWPDTQVWNGRFRVEPRMDSVDARDFAREDEDVMVALEQLEKSLRGQLPG